MVVRLAVSAALALALLCTPAAYETTAQTNCSLAPVFVQLREAVGSEIIGECVGDSSLTADGDLTQPTTRGILVLRVVDGVGAFTDGATTWLYGPEGVQSRPNTERFAWETAPPPVAARPSPEPPSAPVSNLTPVLSARCADIIASEEDMPESLASGLLRDCRANAESHGAQGVNCFEDNLRFIAHGVSARTDSESRLAAARERKAACLAATPGQGRAAEAAAAAGSPISPPLPPLPERASKLTPALVIRCTNLGADLEAAAPRPGGLGHLMTEDCKRYANRHGEIGVACFEPAARNSDRSLGRMGRGGGQAAADLLAASTEYCIVSAERAGR